MISVVTPSFNQVSFIAETLESVQNQSYQSFEHLVIDGMSTDGTIDLLRSVETGTQKKFSWISERDSGQSEALNKGFRQAKGEIIGWLNSDDRYRAGCFEYVVKAFEENPDVDVLYGDYLLVDESGYPLKIRREIDFNKFILFYHKVLYVPTVATFFRRRIFDEENWLDENLHYAMDFDFFIRLSERGYRFKHVPEILADFRLQQKSKTCSSPERQLLEQRQIVLAVAPLLQRYQSTRIKTIALAVLRLVAGIRRYAEKALRGYYWETLDPVALSHNVLRNSETQWK
jgi:glycosyltransferase involved in cell wall biosynthesis